MSDRSLNKMVTVKVLCQVQPVMQTKLVVLLSFSECVFALRRLAVSFVKCFVSNLRGDLFSHPFSWLYIHTFSCNIFLTRD